jgi:hypothetical protein
MSTIKNINLDEDLQRYIIELAQNDTYKRYYTYIKNKFLSIFIDEKFIDYDVFVRILYDCITNNIIFQSNVFDMFNFYEEDEYYDSKMKIINEIVNKLKLMHNDDNIPKQIIQKILTQFTYLLRNKNKINMSIRFPRTLDRNARTFQSNSNLSIDESFLKKIYLYSTISPKTHHFFKYYDLHDDAQFKKMYITMNDYEETSYVNIICIFTEGTMRNPEYLILTNIDNIEMKKKLFIKMTKALLIKFNKEKINMNYLNIFLKKFGTHSNIKLSIDDMNELIKYAKIK